MISIVGKTIVDTDVTYQYVGKSTDEKPLSTNGSTFTELDTSDEYAFDGDESAWIKTSGTK